MMHNSDARLYNPPPPKHHRLLIGTATIDLHPLTLQRNLDTWYPIINAFKINIGLLKLKITPSTPICNSGDIVDNEENFDPTSLHSSSPSYSSTSSASSSSSSHTPSTSNNNNTDYTDDTMDEDEPNPRPRPNLFPYKAV